MKNIDKIILPKEVQNKMFNFFLKTSIPRILKQTGDIKNAK